MGAAMLMLMPPYHGAGCGRRTRPFSRDARAEVAAGDDDRHPAGDVGQAQLDQRRALFVGEQELLGIVGQHADAVHALVDHAVEHAPLTVEVEITLRRERRGRNGIDAGVRRCANCSHVHSPSNAWLHRSRLVAGHRPHHDRIVRQFHLPQRVFVVFGRRLNRLRQGQGTPQCAAIHWMRL
jgi:hypothetical protein